MRDFESSLQRISSKLLSAEAAAKIVKPGHRVLYIRQPSLGIVGIRRFSGFLPHAHKAEI